MPTRDDLLRDIRQALGDDVYEQAVDRIGEDELLRLFPGGAEICSTWSREQCLGAVRRVLGDDDYELAVEQWGEAGVIRKFLPCADKRRIAMPTSSQPTRNGQGGGNSNYQDQELACLEGLVNLVVIIGCLGAICYGVYRLVVYICSSCGVWWEWLVRHITGQ